MSSQAAAAGRLEAVRGLVFIGFPLHAAGKPGVARAEHLTEVAQPMLFLQGTRDALADLPLLTPIVEKLGPRARMHGVEGADHSFHVLKRSGRSDAEVIVELATQIAGFRVA
jgi:predicted alpha/beta-hydrolase family hydrolase